ncbi:MAG: acetyltransferase [Symbiobacteriia bacterium]
MSRVERLVIVGAGGFGREVAWLVEDINRDHPRYDFLGFLDDAATSTPEGYPVLGTIDNWLAGERHGVKVVCAIGDSGMRAAVTRRLSAAGAGFTTLIHPSVRRSRWVEFGMGSVVCAGTTLTTNITVGAHSVINPYCTIGHDTNLGDFTSMMFGVRLSGNVSTGTGVYFGSSSTVIQQVSIGSWTVVGAGAVVTKDLPSAVIAVGVPAKPVKANPRAPTDSKGV